MSNATRALVLPVDAFAEESTDDFFLMFAC